MTAAPASPSTADCHVVDHLQPAHRAVLPRRARTISSRTGSTARSRTTGRSACPASRIAAPSPPIDWVQPGGGESGYIAVKPGDPNVVVGGAVGSGPGMGRLIHYDHRTGQERIISVWPEGYGMGTPPSEHRYRFQWTFPVFYSRWEPRELWIAGNRIFRSVDDGQHWEIAQRGSHPQRRDQDGAVGRAHHQRQYRRRGLRHHLRAGGVAARARRAVGGHRRRAGPPLPRSRADLAAR